MRAKGPKRPDRRWVTVAILVVGAWAAGYLGGFFAKSFVFSSDEGTTAEAAVGARGVKKLEVPPNGFAVHTVLTSSGDNYQNFQTRIMYASYKLVQKMPGGENMVAFTRILHRTVPDCLMEEVPTFHVWDVIKPQCDGWCDYPVANRPNAIMQFFRAAVKDPSMIKAPWVLMTECDYVWMSPIKAPGSAFDPSTPGEQYFYDYIIPQHPDAALWINKLLNGKAAVNSVPQSGPSPAILRLADWQTIGTDYEQMSFDMEGNEEMKTKLGWVREMYAWDVACALHPEIPIITENADKSRLMVQPPFDISMFNASLVHYTWGVLYHEGLPSQNATQVYRWEKRDFTKLEFVVKPERLPMPPDFREGLFLEFDAPLTLPRHQLNVLYLTQLNKAIDSLDDLTEYAQKVDTEIIPAFRLTPRADKGGAGEREALTKAVKFMDFDKAEGASRRLLGSV